MAPYDFMVYNTVGGNMKPIMAAALFALVPFVASSEESKEISDKSPGPGMMKSNGTARHDPADEISKAARRITREVDRVLQKTRDQSQGTTPSKKP
jgi:hypothetical protein